MRDAAHLPSHADLPLDVPLPASSQFTEPFASAELAAAILDTLADAVVVYDAAWRVVGANPAAVTLFGLAQPGRQEALTPPLHERAAAVELLTLEGQALPREQWPATRALAGETLAGARAVDVVARSLDGQEHVLNISGAPLRDPQGRVIGAVCVCRDSTARSRMERELAELAAELESIFTTQVEAVVYVDTNGRIVRMNEAQRRLLISRGLDPEETHIETWAQQTPPYDPQGQPIPLERLPFYRALHGETVIGEHAVELRQRARNGQELALRVSGAPVCDAEGRILGVVLTSHDVTEQRRLEQQRLTMMRVVAHDLAGPVAAVRLYLQTQQHRIEQGRPLFTPTDDLFTQMDHGLVRMQRLLNDLRAATQVEMGTLDLYRARQDVAALCRMEAAAQQVTTGRQVDVSTPTAPVWVYVDGERMGQVIANLLANALKYSPVEQPVAVTVRAEPGQARVEVHDSGPGIPAQEQKRLFEAFHRAAGVKTFDGSGGLGLGLYISKGIIDQHGGDIGVESAVGEGSTFWFTLPLMAQSADADTPHP